MGCFDKQFYKGKRVFITGHTGFKGSWLCKMLINMGAEVTGYALEPPTEPSLFKIAHIERDMTSIIGDIRDIDALKKAFDEACPEIVIHMAAQPIVRDGYKEPRYTYETNVMGTVNILECVRMHKDTVKSFVNVTTDKVYRNNEEQKGYKEDDYLDGYDPYSNSKSCSELITGSYRKSFFDENEQAETAISTVRAGNVIGGGDFAPDRIIPDCIRAVLNNEKIKIRNPYSIRPYQHVLEPLYVYMMIAAFQYEDKSYASYYNVGPDDDNCIETGKLADLFVTHWNDNAEWVNESDDGPHEAAYLKLDCTKLKDTFGWKPVWDVNMAVEKIVQWTKLWNNGEDVSKIMDSQIQEYMCVAHQ